MSKETSNQRPYEAALPVDPDHGPAPGATLLAQLPPLPERSLMDSEALRRLLTPHLVPLSLFENKQAEAIEQNLGVDCLLIEEGLLDEVAYYEALGKAHGLKVIDPAHARHLWLTYADIDRFYSAYFSSQFFFTPDGLAFCPRGLGPEAIGEVLAALNLVMGRLMPEGARRVWLVPPSTIKLAIEAKFSPQLVDYARLGLHESAPEQSAKGGPAHWQWAALAALLIAGGFGLFTAPGMTAFLLSLLFAVFFFLLICLRLGAAMVQSRAALGLESGAPPPLSGEGGLPDYTVLVPLYKEAHMLPQLIAALEALDYPRARLDIKLLLEADDKETIQAAAALRLAPRYHVLIVPDRQPRTKPKALNYGLAQARGEFVVIFDAEDIPAPGQLRHALSLFASHDARLATVQAKLNFYNQRQNWLTRQFTVEYCSLFDGLLPAYSLFDFPLPLGGTSNHFRRRALEAAGGWDAHNVTEDADLGMRLYRRGLVSRVLPSTTYEEACFSYGSWIKQRTRWLKGWMQTYYVHMRQPLRLLQELGAWRFLGFQAIIGGPILASLAHPVFVGILIWQMPYQSLPASLGLTGLWVLSLFNLVAGYFATMWLGAVSLRLRNLTGFVFTILTIPLYWLLISLAAYRALLQLIYAPFHWEKTPHRGKTQK